MKRLAVISFSFLLLAATWLSYTSCGVPSQFTSVKVSTEVGNPMLPSNQILFALCGVITRCNSAVTINACVKGLLGETNVAGRLGLPAGDYGSYTSVIQAEEAGTIAGSLAATNTCYTDISQSSCSDPLVQGAYDTLATDPFRNAYLMIPSTFGSCSTVFAEPVGMKDYYVSLTGNDSNDGSQAHPWATLSHAAQAFVPGGNGATVHVAPGTYQISASPCGSSSCGIATSRSGTSQARIIYRSDELWGAKLASVGASNIWQNSGSYVDIVGFDIVGDSSTNNGIQNTGSFVRVLNNRVHDFPAVPSCPSGSDSAAINHSNLSAHDNDTENNIVFNIGPRPANGLSWSSYCGHANGILVVGPRGHVYNNIVYNVSTFGIEATDFSTNIIIGNNLVFNSGSLTDLGNTLGGGIYINGTGGNINDNSTISNNIIRNNSGFGIYGSSGAGPNNAYLNNLLYSNGTALVNNSGRVAGTIASDPMMVNFQNDGSGDYRLLNTSPAVDAGSSACAVLTGNGNCNPSADYTGFSRPYGSTLDIGPYEWHL